MLLRGFLVILCAFLFQSLLRAVEWSYDIHNPPEGIFWEQWMEVYLKESKIGYARHTLIRKGEEIHSFTYTKMRFSRGAFAVTLSNEQVTTESLAGVPKSFRYVSLMGQIPLVADGIVEKGRVSITSSQAGVETSNEYAWKEGAKMAWGFTRETAIRGFAAGTEYKLPLYSPDIQAESPIETSITVGEEEKFLRRGEEVYGVRVVSEMDFLLGKLKTISWIDENGDTVKSQMSMGGLDVVMYASDQFASLSDFVPADIFDYTLLKTDRTIPHDAKAVTYEISFKAPIELTTPWPETEFQRTLSRNSKRVILRVEKADHEQVKLSHGPEMKADLSEYLSDNTTLNTRDPVLIELADLVENGSGGPLELADRLRKFTSNYITGKSLEVGFATASEVARRSTGDCTEHAVLLSTLGRIKGLPTRVVTGIAYIPEYLDEKDVFGFHMWSQFYIHGKWIDFDAALEESECSPTRIAFYAGALDDNSFIDMSLSLMDLMGQIEVSVREIELE